MIEAGNGLVHPIMVVGSDNLAYSIVCGLLANGHQSVLLTADRDEAVNFVHTEIGDTRNLRVLTDWPDKISSSLIVLVTADKLDLKKKQINLVEKRAVEDAMIAINMESVDLQELQKGSLAASRLFGLNWAYPVQQTFFAEIIANSGSDKEALEQLKNWVSKYWDKDPYIAQKGCSIRARMMAAMLREGLYLVENDFASIESVDRACRNDAGYYLPFAGNFRYMDLMGTYAYGLVMKDLNSELSNSTSLSPILQEKKAKNEGGMKEGRGFYVYSAEDKLHWEAVFKEFSQEIRQLIMKYSHETINS